MLISIIIPTCNRNDLLAHCLDRLSPETQSAGFEYELIVTDDSKNNLAKSLVEEKYPWAKWVAGPQRGPAANRNNGARHAIGEWLVFIDDDCLPENTLLAEYQKGINNIPASLAFEGAILPDDPELLKKDLSECPINTDGDCFWSANVCINKALFEKINGFDEDYLIAAQEDQQMKINIETATKDKIIFLRQCLVIHPVRFAKVKDQLKKIPVASRNFIMYVNKNKRILNYDSVLAFGIQQFRFHFKRSLRLLRSGQTKSFIVSAVWLFYGVPLNIINFRASNKGNN